MKVTAYKTPKVTPRSHRLEELLDAALPPLPDGCVVAVTAKVVSLCEGRVVAIEGADKDELIRQESQWYVPRTGAYNMSFTVTHNMFIPTAGIDESNGNGYYILWPQNPQAQANAIREHLVQKYGVHNVGVIITDSTTRPLQRGTTGIAIACSGFKPLKSYIGQPDVFGRELQFQKSHMANGLAAAAVVLMGEGNEQTPLAVIEDVPFIGFQAQNPGKKQLADTRIAREDDIYWPLFKAATWQKGGQE